MSLKDRSFKHLLLCHVTESFLGASEAFAHGTILYNVMIIIIIIIIKFFIKS